MLVVAKEMASFLFLGALFGLRYCLVIFPGASIPQWGSSEWTYWMKLF